MPRLAVTAATAVATVVVLSTLTACGSRSEALQTSASKPFNPRISQGVLGSPTAEQPAQGGRGGTAGTVTPRAAEGHRAEGGHAEQALSGGHDGERDGGAKGREKVTACGPDQVRVVAERLARPVDHLLLKAVNTSGAACELRGHPEVRFGGAPLAAYEDSRPQSVVRLAAGGTGYAVVMTSRADGGPRGATVRSLRVAPAAGQAARAVPLPGGSAYVDASAWVSYWQGDVADAVRW